MLHSIRFGGDFSGHEINVFYINSDLENYKQFKVSFSNLRLPHDTTFQLRIPDAEFQTIITKIKNGINDTNLRRVEREIAVFVDYHYALNTTDSYSPTERFLSYWSSFNALYTSFAAKQMKPVIKKMIDGIDAIDKKILDFSDHDEILFICSVSNIDTELIEKRIYILRNDIIHGNTYLPMLYSSNTNYSSIIYEANQYSLVLKECVSTYFYLCLDTEPEADNLLEIAKRWIEKKIAAMKKTDEEKNELTNQINSRYQELINSESET